MSLCAVLRQYRVASLLENTGRNAGSQKYRQDFKPSSLKITKYFRIANNLIYLHIKSLFRSLVLSFPFWLEVLQKEQQNTRKISRSIPTGKIAEKVVWRSVFLCTHHYILNADSTRTHSSAVTF